MVRLRPLGVDSRFAGRPAENASTPHTPPLNRLLARTETSGADEFYGRGQGLLLTSGGQSGHGRAQRYPAVTPLIHPYPSHTSPPHASTFTTGAAGSPPAVFRDPMTRLSRCAASALKLIGKTGCATFFDIEVIHFRSGPGPTYQQQRESSYTAAAVYCCSSQSSTSLFR